MLFSLLPYFLCLCFFLVIFLSERKEEDIYLGNAKGKFKNLSHRSEWGGHMSSQSALVYSHHAMFLL